MVDLQKVDAGSLVSAQIFEKLPELLKPEAVAEILGISVRTVHDWHYRQKLRKVQKGLFIKFNRLLYLRTEVLKQWISSQNPLCD
jgi:hypothetical protein